MLFMAIVTWKPEHKIEMVKRSQEKGSMRPEGIKFINEWVDVSGGKSFSLFEANNSNDILSWVTVWTDIMEFEITPVMELDEVMQAIKGNF